VTEVGRLHFAADRGGNFRPLRRPHRPQIDLNSNTHADGHCDLVALVPTYDSIGVWGAVILTFLRFMQGVGGEWGGSVLLSMEWCKSHGHRGFVAAWPQFGSPAGLFLA
jgi:hypothetical protein